MCGIAGMWSTDQGDSSHDVVGAMMSALLHRGPDSSGFFRDESAGIALGHRRLSIVDLSHEGHQPMRSSSGRYVISFNGEVYNFRELRAELEGLGGQAAFRGGSDTEVMLAAIEAWGLDRALERFVGMFAFALWDAREHTLYLVRDRVGVKPLYYTQSGPRLAFASELRALTTLPTFTREVDHEAFLDYAATGYVGGTRSIYREARKVPPGAILAFSSPRTQGSERRYWDAEERFRAALAERLSVTSAEAEERVHESLEQAVRLRLVADVPLGAFLSGGIDSSIVVALMQRLSSRAVKTFTVGTDDLDHDEAGFAERVARHLGTDHHTLRVSPADVVPMLMDMPKLFDEPFADSSQLPTYLVSKFARTQVTVALSGDGGDELFAGYNRHVWLPSVWRASSLLSVTLRERLASRFGARLVRSLDRMPAALRSRLPVKLPADKLGKVLRIMSQSDFGGAYRQVCRLGEPLVSAGPTAPATLPEVGTSRENLMLWDLMTYLPGDILTKVDRASMAVSLEAREPLLDHRLIELAWRLPDSLRVQRGRGKLILRRILGRYVPPALFERPKSGFSVPIGQWLRGPLREWVETYLRSAEGSGFFDGNRLRSLWQRHLSGQTDAGHSLWSAVAFEAWRGEVSRH